MSVRPPTDRKLIPRIKLHLEAHPDKTHPEDITDALRSAHNEYSRTQRGPFLRVVTGAVEYLQSNGDFPADEADEALEPVKYMTVKDTNAMNGAMATLYRASGASDQQPTTPRAPSTPAGGATPRTEGRTTGKKRQRGHDSNEDDRPAKRSRNDDGSNAVPAARDLGSDFLTKSTAKLRDVGGVEVVLEQVRELIVQPIRHPEVYAHIGVPPPRGILLHGPPGCGKTLLANAIAGELEVPFLRVSAPELVAGVSGESESKIRKLFDEAVSCAPSIIFIDEIDAIASKRESSSRGMEQRIVAQLLTCMDDLALEKTGGKMVMVLGATNRPDGLDTALRRGGRFDRELALGIPDDAARARILEVVCRPLRVAPGVDFKKLAQYAVGYVGVDLEALKQEAANVCIRRSFSALNAGEALMSPTTPGGPDAMEGVEEPEDHGALQERAPDTPREKLGAMMDQVEPLSDEQLATLYVTMEDFLEALKRVQPSSKREGFATVPDVKWDDIGALNEVRQELIQAVVEPITHPDLFAAYGLHAPPGILLYGPPGCGKTLLAKAIANESGASFISVKGPELLNKYVGESERAVRQVFERARASAPCVIFFDELDALAPRRSGSSNGGGERVVNMLLTEMDGLEPRKRVFIIAATNRPDIIDPAMLRPGRLDRPVFVPLPSPVERGQILQTVVRGRPMAAEVNLVDMGLSARCTGFSGADLTALVNEASYLALHEFLAKHPRGGAPMEALHEQHQVLNRHFDAAFKKVLPSVSEKDERVYNNMKGRLRTSRARMDETPAAEGAAGAPPQATA